MYCLYSSNICMLLRILLQLLCFKYSVILMSLYYILGCVCCSRFVSDMVDFYPFFFSVDKFKK